MSPYTSIDIELINKLKNSNETTNEFLTNKRSEWTSKIETIFSTIEHRNINATDFKKVIDSQAYALSYQQHLNDEVAYFMSKLSKSMSNLKGATQEKFIFYSTGFGIKTNTTEKRILIDAHVAEYARNIELLESHIDFLRETVKNLQTFNYSVKNIISLMDFLGK